MNLKFDAVFVLSWQQKNETHSHDFFTENTCLHFVFVDSNPLFFLSEEFVKHRKRQIFWIGDGDSFCAEKGLLPLQNIVMLNREKSLSDFAAALSFWNKQNENSENFRFNESVFAVLGVFGGRRDHEMANLLEIQNFVKNEFIQNSVHKGENIFGTRVHIDNCCVCFYGELRLTLKVLQVFSIFAFEPTFVEIKGARYSGAFDLCPGSKGLSNEAIEETVVIKSEKPVFLYCA